MLAAFKRLWKYGQATQPRNQLAAKLARRQPGVDGVDADAGPSETMNHALGQSVHIRHVDTGSCNGCDWEITALLNPVYDAQRFGLDFVASPRHADVLLMTGGVTRNLEEAVRKTFDATPAPKRVVAVGACACGNGMIGRTYAHAGRIDDVVPVSVKVPGCPPRPEEILQGILTAVGQTGELQGE